MSKAKPRIALKAIEKSSEKLLGCGFGSGFGSKEVVVATEVVVSKEVVVANEVVVATEVVVAEVVVVGAVVVFSSQIQTGQFV